MKRAIQKNTTADTIGLLEAFEEFIEEKEAQNKSAKTIHNYRQTFEAFCKYNGYDRDTSINCITRKGFLEWVNDMAEDKRPVTVNHYLRDVRVFLYWCMDDDHRYIEKSFKVKEMRMQEEKPKSFSDEDMERLMEKPNLKADFPEWRTYAIVCWMMDNGSRTETVCNARMKDVDFKRKMITYAHTKNRKAQIVGMSDALSTVLKEYIRIWRHDAEAEDWLFPNIGGGQLTGSGLRCAFKSYCLNRGVKQHNVHGLRHTFSLYYIRNNGNQFKLQKILGHSTMEMTRRYVNLASDDITSDYDRFSPLANAKRKASRARVIHRAEDE